MQRIARLMTQNSEPQFAQQEKYGAQEQNCDGWVLHTKHPKRAVGDLIFRSGFRDVQKVARQPSDFLAQSTARLPIS